MSASGIQIASKTSPTRKKIIAARTAKKQWLPIDLEHLYAPSAHLYGTKKTSQNGYSKIPRSTKPIIPRILQQECLKHCLQHLRRWPSPGLTLSSILLTPQPFINPKWSSAALALPPQAQQNSYWQNPHVMWLQPAFFSILVLHVGQKDTLSLFSSAQPFSYLAIASAQDTSSPCHTSRHLKQTSVEHLGHVSLSASLLYALICV